MVRCIKAMVVIQMQTTTKKSKVHEKVDMKLLLNFGGHLDSSNNNNTKRL